MDVEAFIRDRAALGWSRVMVGEVLKDCGFSDHKFRQFLEVLPDVEWQTNQSPRRKAFYDSQRGHCSEARWGALNKSRETKRLNGKKYQIGSTSAIMADQILFWADEISVSHSQIRRRLADGDSVYDAFFAPQKPRYAKRNGWKDAKNRLDTPNHEKNRVDRQSAQATRDYLIARNGCHTPEFDSAI